MPRYTRQYDKFSCGPTMIINVLKWAGIKASWHKDVRRLQRACKTDKVIGTYSEEYLQVLHEELVKNDKFPTLMEFPPSIEDVKELLSWGVGIIFRYDHDPSLHPDCGHVCFIESISKSGKSVYVINMFSDTEVRHCMPIEDLEKYINSECRMTAISVKDI